MKPQVPEIARPLTQEGGVDRAWYRLFELLASGSPDQAKLRAIQPLPASPTNEDLAAAFNALLAAIKT